MLNSKHSAAAIKPGTDDTREKRRSKQVKKRPPDAGSRAAGRTTKSKGTDANSKILRISFLVPRDAIPRLEWLMKVRRIPTKVDLLREALNHYEDYVIEEEAKRSEQRRLAGAPPLHDPKD
ncbi:MAG: hypothetical protein KDJ47_03680 [Hyphomicrobiaceae bacterium]|nr:hypothetical protein [Hyphomicrobiaceae bacterium]